MSRLITGLQPVREAIRVHGEKLERVVIDDRGGPQIEAVARFAQDRGVKTIDRVARGDLDRASKGARHQGAIAYAPDLTLVSIDDLVTELTREEEGTGAPDAPAPKQTRLVVALDEIEDPQNFGAVIRSSVALGAMAIVWPEHHAAPLSPATFRASAGAVEHARLCRVSSLQTALDKLHKGASAVVIGLDANAQVDVRDVTIEPGSVVVLVIGAEGKGLRRPVKAACTTLARLPMSGAIDSLNASVAGGIAIYEIVHRRVRAMPTSG